MDARTVSPFSPAAEPGPLEKDLQVTLSFVVPADTIVLLYGSFAKGTAGPCSDVDLWLLHRDEHMRNRFAASLPDVRNRLVKTRRRAVSIENDCLPWFLERIEYLEPWSLELCGTAKAILDPQREWPRVRARAGESLRKQVDAERLSWYFKQYVDNKLRMVVGGTQRVAAELYMLLTAAAAREAVRRVAQADKEEENTGPDMGPEALLGLMRKAGWEAPLGFSRRMDALVKNCMAEGRDPDLEEIFALYHDPQGDGNATD